MILLVAAALVVALVVVTVVVALVVVTVVVFGSGFGPGFGSVPTPVGPEPVGTAGLVSGFGFIVILVLVVGTIVRKPCEKIELSPHH